MPRDLFEENGIDPSSDRAPVDLFEANGISVDQPQAQQAPSFLDKAKNALYKMGDANTDAVIGFGDAITGLPAQINNILMPQSLQTKIPHNSDGQAYQVGKLGGDITNMMLGGAPALEALTAAKATPYIGKAAEYLTKQGILPSAARLGLGGGAYEATVNPDHRLAAGLIGGGLGAAGGGLGAALSKLAPSRYFRGNLTPDQLMDNSRIAGETKTGLGDVIDSPTLQHKLANSWARNPLSGADEVTGQNAISITNKGNDILSKYLGDTHPSNVDEEIKEGLFNAFKSEQKRKSDLYKIPEKMADDAGVNLQLKGLAETSNKYMNVIEDQNFLKYEPEEKKLLSRLINYQNPVKETESSILDSSGKAITTPKYPTLSESNMLAGKLNNLSNKYRSSPEPEKRNQANVLAELGGALKNDIKSELSATGDTKLVDAFKSAEKNYQKNFSPFLDKDIYKFVNGRKVSQDPVNGVDQASKLEGGKDADDLISTFIKTGKNTDKGNQLAKLMKKLDPKTQDLVRYSYLSRAMQGPENSRTVNPSKLANLWNDSNLGQKQKSVLIPQKEGRQAMDDYSKLASMNKESLERMFNPKTGYRGIDLSTSLMHLLGGGAGSYIGGNQGGAAGALSGFAGGFIAPGILAKMLVSGATSPSVRRAIVEKMVKNEPSEIPKSLANTLSGVTSPILNMYMSPSRLAYSLDQK